MIANKILYSGTHATQAKKNRESSFYLFCLQNKSFFKGGNLNTRRSGFPETSSGQASREPFLAYYTHCVRSCHPEFISGSHLFIFGFASQTG
jgi:hypothetical protein